MIDADSIFVGYLVAHGRVLSAGYADDIDWAESLRHVKPDEYYVMNEGAWVIVNSGFRYAVAKKLWPGLQRAFCQFNPHCIGPELLPRAMKVLRHERKMNAIVSLAETLHKEGAGQILEDAKDPPKLMRLAYIGKITCWHFAKVLGVDCVKPDVHLVRAAKAAGYETPLDLCKMLHDRTGDRLTVIDSILWRYGEQQQKKAWPAWPELFARSGG